LSLICRTTSCTDIAVRSPTFG